MERLRTSPSASSMWPASNKHDEALILPTSKDKPSSQQLDDSGYLSTPRSPVPKEPRKPYLIIPQPESCLLSLPAELRNKIWDYVCDDNRRNCNVIGRTSAVDSLRFLETCKQIHEEAFSMAFQRTAFTMGDLTYDDYRWAVKDMHPEKLRAISCLVDAATTTSTKSLRSTNLRHLQRMPFSQYLTRLVILRKLAQPGTQWIGYKSSTELGVADCLAGLFASNKSLREITVLFRFASAGDSILQDYLQYVYKGRMNWLLDTSYQTGARTMHLVNGAALSQYVEILDDKSVPWLRVARLYPGWQEEGVLKSLVFTCDPVDDS